MQHQTATAEPPGGDAARRQGLAAPRRWGLKPGPPPRSPHTPLALGCQSAGSGTSAGVAGAARRPRAASWTCTRSPSDPRLRRLKVRPCHVTLETSAKRSSFAMSSTACGKPAGGLSPAARRTAGPPRRRARIDLLIPRVSNPGGARGNPGGGSGHAGSRGPPPPAPSPAVAGRPPARGEGRGLPCADGTALSSPCPCAAAGKAAGDGADLRVRRRRGAVGMRAPPEGGPVPAAPLPPGSCGPRGWRGGAQPRPSAAAALMAPAAGRWGPGGAHTAWAPWATEGVRPVAGDGRRNHGNTTAGRAEAKLPCRPPLPRFNGAGCCVLVERAVHGLDSTPAQRPEFWQRRRPNRRRPNRKRPDRKRPARIRLVLLTLRLECRRQNSGALCRGLWSTAAGALRRGLWALCRGL